jgi:hypothetical protein
VLPVANSVLRDGVHSGGTAADKAEEGAGDDRSVCPEFPGLHAAYNATYNRMQLRKEKLNP